VEILLIIAMISVGAALLYVAVTFDTRITRLLNPQIKNAKDNITERIDERAAWVGDNVAEALRAAEAAQDSRQAWLEREQDALRERLERVESMISGTSVDFARQVESIGNWAGPVGQQQEALADSLGEVKGLVAQASESLARQSSQVQEIERLAKDNEPAIAKKFADLAGSLRAIGDQQSLAASKLDEIGNALDRSLEFGRQAERHDNWAAGQLLIIADRLEALLNGDDGVAGYLRARLDDEIARADPDLASRVISSSLSLGQPAEDIARGLFASLCARLSLRVLLSPPRDSAGSGPYLLWRSTASQRLETVLASLLIACADDMAEPRPGLSELRDLLVVLHASGSGTIRLGPMIINRTPAVLLGCVLTGAEASEVCPPDRQGSPGRCEERLRGLEPDRLIDLTSWADSRTLTSEDREAP
jgi:predicted  nucleic acid-binding Zn-ribbon protein